MKTSIYCLLLALLFSTQQGCKKESDVPAQDQGLTDPNEITKVVVIPGATVEQGNPPVVTRTGNEPVLSTSTPTVEAISGLESTYTLNYSNATGGITVVYIQFDGATTYLKIRIPANTARNGQINIPMRMPADKYTARPSGISFCTFATIANGACQSKCSNDFASKLPPRPGKGTATVNGVRVDANAVCDLDFGPYGRGYAILTGQSKGIILYNMRQGGNQLGNFESLVNNSSNGSISAPFAFYTDGTNVYWSASGSATINGKTASASGVFKDLLSSRQISISATGNCQ